MRGAYTESDNAPAKQGLVMRDYSLDKGQPRILVKTTITIICST